MCFFEGCVYLFGGVDELGASAHSIFALCIDPDVSLVQQSLVWKELDSELEINSSRTSVFYQGCLGIFQVGSRSLGSPSADNIEKGLVHWDVYKTVSLQQLKEKRLDSASLQPRNPKLCRIEHTKTTLGKMPRAYTMQTPKECKLLDYSKRFRDTFFALYGHRRQPVLTPMNECGVEKFACSFIRPTKLHYKELYDLQDITDFVSDAIQYEKLENPLILPCYWTSPTSTLKWQTGDAFDLAVLSASLLKGAGYDAFVCVGYAPREIVFHDQTRIVHGFRSWEEMLASEEMPLASNDNTENTMAATSNRYKPKQMDRRILSECDTQWHETSDFAEMQETESKSLRSSEARDSIVHDAQECRERMHEKSRYVHAWIMIAPSEREVRMRPSVSFRWFTLPSGRSLNV